MTDVSVDFDTLRSSATTIGAAGRAVRNSGELGYISESMIGSNEVASVLQDVATEHSIRADVASATLVTVGRARRRRRTSSLISTESWRTDGRPE